jgi:tetratricopeptide (TPR) repeat protein
MPVSDQTQQAKDGFTTPLLGLCQRQPALRLGCILASLILLEPVVGQEEVADYNFHNDPANQYLDAIDNIEAEYGPYAMELMDLYQGLGQTLLKNGDFEEARDAFNRGVLVVRVNSGPNSPEQTNNLYRIADIATLLGELNAADKVLHNIYFINSNYHGEDSPEMLPVLERMYQWYMVTRPPGSRSLDYKDYDRIIEMTEEMVRISEAAKGSNHPDTAVAFRCHAEAQFQMVRHLTGSGMTLIPAGNMALASASQTSLSLESDSVYKHYRVGMRAFNSYLESILASESTTPLEHAEALADQGDWYLLFEKPGRSRVLYKQGYQILAQSEEYSELADSYMRDPKPMHFVINPLPDFLENALIELHEMSLDISITVTSLGYVRSVEVLKAPEGMSKADLRNIKMRVWSTPFRPAMKEGEVVNTKDFIWHYAIEPQGSAS